MRRAAKVDANQGVIVSALRRAGVRVHITSDVGRGFPDLMCAKGEVMRLLEVKDGAKPPSARKLTPAEAEFHATFPEHVAVVCSPEEALEAMGVRLG